MSRRLCAFLVLLALALTSCVTLPEQGAVRSVTRDSQGEDDALVDYTPPGPKQGSAPAPLVENFLTAMTATPLNTFVARQFLAADSSSGWVPERGTLLYGTHRLLSLPGGRVVLQLRDVIALDDRGRWLGDPTRGRGRDITLQLVKEDGEWRISRPPNRLIIPRTHFDTRYQQYFLYFFDKTAQVLVPEPVYVPRGPQAATLLVTGLLEGPEPDLAGVEDTFLPPGSTLDGISVPVSREGTAEVPLSDHVLDVDDERLGLLFAQLACTLGQITGVERVRVTVDDTPVDLPGARVDVSASEWSELDPSVAWASTALFGIRERRVVSVTGNRETRLNGAFGSLPLGLRSVGVDLAAQHVAGVTGDGTRVLEADKDKVSGRPATMADVRTVYTSGTNVLRPAYDLYGQMWLVDRARAGARVAVVRDGVPRTIEAPGVSGEPVIRFVLSRDGTRLVAQLRREGVDRLVVSRVQRDAKGRVRAVGPAAPLPLTGAGTPEIRDVAWRTPGSLALLSVPSPGISQVLVAKIDGSSTPDELTTGAELFRDEAVRLVSSPTAGAPLYMKTSTGQLFSLAATGRWTGTSVREGLGAPTFVG